MEERKGLKMGTSNQKKEHVLFAEKKIVVNSKVFLPSKFKCWIIKRVFNWAKLYNGCEFNTEIEQFSEELRTVRLSKITRQYDEAITQKASPL